MVTSDRAARWVAAAAPVGVALVAGWMIVPTVLPGVGFWDTAESQTVPPILGTMHPTGFPAYVLLGWLASLALAPLGEPAFRMNLLSTVLVASAAGLTVVLVRRLTDSTPIAAADGLGLALTPVSWKIATHADAHALHLALFAPCSSCCSSGRRRAPGRRVWIAGWSPGRGVGVAANHSLTLLLPPAIAVYVFVVDPAILRRPRLVLACTAVLAAVMVLLYLELPLRGGPFRAPLVYGRPETWDGFRYIVLAEQFRGSLVDPFGDLAGKLRQLVDLTAAQFGILAPLIPVGFFATVRRAPAFAILTGLAAAVTVFFAASYVNADIGRYYLGPILIAWTWLAVLAVGAIEAFAALTGAGPGGLLTDRSGGVPVDRGRPGLADTATVALVGVALLVPTIGALPNRAAQLDESDNRVAERWLDAALETMEPNAVVVSWWSYSTPLWYAQHIEGRFPDGFVVDDRTRLDLELGEVTDVIDAHLGTRPVYVIRSSTVARSAAIRLGRPSATMLYRVVSRLAPAHRCPGPACPLFRPTTRRPTSRAWSSRRSRFCLRSPRRSR
jgi:hypothetical protein